MPVRVHGSGIISCPIRCELRGSIGRYVLRHITIQPSSEPSIYTHVSDTGNISGETTHGKVFRKSYPSKISTLEQQWLYSSLNGLLGLKYPYRTV